MMEPVSKITEVSEPGVTGVLHIESQLGWFLSEVLEVRAPRAVCGESLITDQDEPDPYEAGWPLCLDCLAEVRPMITTPPVVAAFWRKVSKIVERFGFEPIRPAGSLEDLEAYAVAYARVYSIDLLFQKALDDEADRRGLTGRRRDDFYIEHTVESETVSAAARAVEREASRRISAWQEAAIAPSYPLIKVRKRPAR